MWKRVQDWWKAEGAMVQLSGLDDRLLADMALEREDLRGRVRGRVRGRGGQTDQRIAGNGGADLSRPVCTCG